MKLRVSAAVAAAVLFASASYAGQPNSGGGGGGGFTPPGDDPAAFFEDPVAGNTGVGSTGTGAGALPSAPAGATHYVTTLNGMVQGGVSAGGEVTQQVPFFTIGQVFNAPGGVLNQLSFVDTNGAAGGEILTIMAFDPTSFSTIGDVLYTSEGGALPALTSYGDGGGTGGVDALAYHTWTNINLDLTAGQQYYAFITMAEGSQVFNGSNSRYPSGLYGFEAATADSALGGELVYQDVNGNFTQVAQIEGRPPIQALYDIAISASPTPEAATWAMMVCGFGAVGAALRSRRKVAVSFG